MSAQHLAFEWTETNREWIIETPIRIAAYLVAALVVRFLLHRMIDRATRRPEPGDGSRKPALIRHLRERGSANRNPAVAERRAQRAKTIGSVLKSTVSIILLVWVVLTVLAELGVNIAPFIASAGIIGLAIGFGAQNLVRDFVSGVFMLLEDQYGVGDFVDLGEASGEVESVGLRVTTVRDVDGTLWYVRNGEIARVGNMSQDFAVARVDVPIAPTADVDKAQRVAADAAAESADRDGTDMLGAVEMLGVQEVSAERVLLRLTVKTRANGQWAVARRLRRDILRAFDANSIDLPYPRAWAMSGSRPTEAE